MVALHHSTHETRFDLKTSESPAPSIGTGSILLGRLPERVKRLVGATLRLPFSKGGGERDAARHSPGA